ncbi:MAG: NTP transferase domain-containing protein [Actinobacteria bacterium]|jgi:bifunctional UDP-N-acetylglucosamine pyrophosphorylase/glucosamine-1-phosphate N-acetyltransferase|nr:NTP transferase domain-containing protein [Actinomycetota bacterium]
MSSRPLFATMLAAGEGTRMKSDRPKTLARICGKPMGVHVLDALCQAGVQDAVVVVGHKAERVEAALAAMAPTTMKLHFAEQSKLNGTGDALSVALTVLPDALGYSPAEMPVAIVVPADTPLITADTLRNLAESHIESKAAATLITAEVDEPFGYGRIVRTKDGKVARVVEERDAINEQKNITEINTGIYAFNLDILAPTLRRITPINDQGEYYLTDCISILSEMGYLVNSIQIADRAEALGVNDRVQLAEAEHQFRQRINRAWMKQGVTMVDPESTYIEATVTIGQDTTIWPGSHLAGNTQIGLSVEVGPETRLLDCTVGDGAKVTRCEATQADIGSDAIVGPWVVLAPGAKVEPGTSTGSFKVLG